MEKISIILPVYNEEKRIKKLLEQLLNQTYKYYEIIVIDDCSTDRTKEILKKTKHKKLTTIFSKTNKGPGPMRNQGIKASKGQLILFFDSDVNPINKSFIKNMKLWFDKLNSDKLAGIEAQQIPPTNGNIWQNTFYRIPKVPGNTTQLGDYIKCDFASTTASLWKKSIIQECGGLDERLRLGDDMKLSYQTQKKGYHFYSVPVFIEHTYRNSLPKFLKEQFWYGVGGGINLLENNQHITRLKTFIIAIPFILIFCVICPQLLLLPFLIYLPNAWKHAKYFALLLTVPYLKHITNLLGTYYGILFKEQAFNQLKGRH